MENSDLKQADSCSYFKVIIFLISILVFWMLGGWLAGYALPCDRIILLLISSFQGKLGVEFNHFQKQFQDARINTSSNQRKQIRALNNLDAQAEVYLSILDRLNVENPNSRKRIIDTAVALQSKRNEVLKHLEPIRPESYKVLAGIQQGIIDPFSFNAVEDYRQLNQLIFNLISTIKASSSFESKDSLLNKISKELSKSKNIVSPSRTQLIDSLGSLFHDLLLWNEKPLEEDNSEASIDDLFKQRHELAQSFNELFRDSWNKTQELEDKLQTIENLEETVARLCSQISSSKQDLNQALNRNRQKQAQLDKLDKLLNNIRNENSNFQYQISNLNNQVSQLLQQKSSLEKQINQLVNRLREANNRSSNSNLSLSNLQEQLRQVSQERDRLRSQIKDLREQINSLVEERFSGSNILGTRHRSLSGQYIGNLSNPQTRYHFNIDCPDWWSLVGQYLYGGKISNSRKEIVSSDGID